MKRILFFGFLFSFAVLFLFSCQKELSQETNSNNASFSLHDDSTQSCYPIIVNGTYYNGVSATHDTDYVKVVVNVKTTGNYSISSSLSNGFKFVDSGFFSKTGIDTLTLHAQGTPILITTTDFTVSADSLGECSFFVNVQDSTGTGLGGGSTLSNPTIDTSYVDANPATDSSWHFTDSATGKTYSGTLPKAYSSFRDSSGIYILTIAGVTADLSQTFGFELYTSNATISPGVYPITGANVLGLADNATSGIVFVSSETLITNATSYSYIKITSYDAATKHVKGSFHCWATDTSGVLHLLKGSFNAYLS